MQVETYKISTFGIRNYFLASKLKELVFLLKAQRGFTRTFPGNQDVAVK